MHGAESPGDGRTLQPVLRLLEEACAFVLCQETETHQEGALDHSAPVSQGGGAELWTQKLADSLKLAGSPFQGQLQGSHHRCVWEPARIAVSEAPLRLTDQNLHFKQDFQGTARSRTHQSFQRDNL